MRASGVLLPVSSLSSKYGIGCFSKEAYQFVDFLKKNGQSYWQILPLGQTSYGDSPYQSFSTFAGNPYFISLEKLIGKGLLKRRDCDAYDFGGDPADVDYGKMYRARYRLLRKAFTLFYAVKDADFVRFLDFREKESAWLEDYALFMALKDQFGGKSWVEWPDDIRLREPEALGNYREKLEVQILFYEYLQYEFFSQWEELKSYANEKGIKIIGDIPIYVALDSADAWAQPELFQFDGERKPTSVAGCPPDAFSATGQLWGNPLYDWDYHKETNYAWWIRRVSACYRMYDVIRIDHFRGFDEYYAIPAKDDTAEFGKWEKGPGMELFDALHQELGDLNVIVEDLGYITDSVRELVHAVGFPNMKVLEFAFDAKDTGPRDYLPYNYDKNCVVYTGTHDNETLRGWLDSIPGADYGMIEKYLGRKVEDRDEMVMEIIRLAQASAANLCIIPMQDYLILDNKARINEPSTLGKNWRWRLLPNQLTLKAGLLMKGFTKTYGRMPSHTPRPKEQDKGVGKDAKKAAGEDADGKAAREAVATGRDAGQAAREVVATGRDAGQDTGQAASVGISKDIGRAAREVIATSRDVGRAAREAVATGRDAGQAAREVSGRDAGQAAREVAATGRDVGQDTGQAASVGMNKDMGQAAREVAATGRDVGQDTGQAASTGINRDTGKAVREALGRDAGRVSREAVSRDTGRVSREAVSRDTGKAVKEALGRDAGRVSREAVSRDTGRISREAAGRDIGQAARKVSGRDTGKSAREAAGKAMKEAAGADAGRGADKDTSAYISEMIDKGFLI